ncbi:MAG: heme biosynthesis HemY N-terminal domain-containing protein [Beijerinckiaceae bacterium]
MIRIVFFLLVLTGLALGFAWLADQPGSVSLAFAGKTYEMDLVVALGFALAALIFAMILWSVVRFVFRIPTLMSLTARMRRRNKGYAALSRGMVAAGAGDAKTAVRAARDAEKLMGGEPLALLLSAQAAQLSGDRAGAERIFRRMIEAPETRLLGLRGLHAEARRRGDDAAAGEFARQAHEIAAVPWAGQAMLERHALSDDWKGALAVVEANFARKAITRAEADRQRAVLKTAMAEQLRERDPSEALALAREAIKLAPDLTPASALAGSLLAQKGDLRRAGRILENAWKRAPHPDLARAYVDLRHGDAAGDRLNRAKALARLAPGHPESGLAVARSALEARQFDLARRTMAELIGDGRRPTVRACLTMADIEETEHGPSGLMREWLARAARAPRDPAWVADGVVSDRWLPASPVTGQIDAFRWETPVERLGGPADDAPPPIWPDPESAAPPPEIAGAPRSLQGAGALAASAGAAVVLDHTPDPVAPVEAEPRVSDAAKAADPPPVEAVEPPQEPAAAASIAGNGPADDAVKRAEREEVSAVAEAAGAKPLVSAADAETVSSLVLPDHIVTAPDDPGPDATAEPPPAAGRKRGLFG